MNKKFSTRLNLQSVDKKKERLIDWNTDTLLRHLRQVVVRRDVKNIEHTVDMKEIRRTERKLQRGQMVIDEVAEVIVLPNYDQTATQAQGEGMPSDLSDEVAQQLRAYVERIAQLYPDNAFHNVSYNFSGCTVNERNRYHRWLTYFRSPPKIISSSTQVMCQCMSCSHTYERALNILPRLWCAAHSFFPPFLQSCTCAQGLFPSCCPGLLHQTFPARPTTIRRDILTK